MQMPTTIYELTPTLGLAVEAPSFQQVETQGNELAFRVTSKVFVVVRANAGDEWERLKAPR